MCRGSAHHLPTKFETIMMIEIDATRSFFYYHSYAQYHCYQYYGPSFDIHPVIAFVSTINPKSRIMPILMASPVRAEK